MTTKYMRRRSRLWSELSWCDKVGELIAGTIVLSLPIILIFIAYILGD